MGHWSINLLPTGRHRWLWVRPGLMSVSCDSADMSHPCLSYVRVRGLSFSICVYVHLFFFFNLRSNRRPDRIQKRLCTFILARTETCLCQPVPLGGPSTAGGWSFSGPPRGSREPKLEAGMRRKVMCV